MQEEEYEKVHIDLPNHWATEGESLWALPLGNELYRIENIPFYAYGVNYHDIVRAVEDDQETIPLVKKVVESGGHRTFRVVFEKHIDKKKQEEILNAFEASAVSGERASDIYVSLDLDPEGDYEAFFAVLEKLMAENVLSFETCEARVAGSFDDLPEEETDDS